MMRHVRQLAILLSLSVVVSSCGERDPVVSIAIDLSGYRITQPLATGMWVTLTVYDGPVIGIQSLFDGGAELHTSGRNATATLAYDPLPEGRPLMFFVYILASENGRRLQSLQELVTLPKEDIVLGRDLTGDDYWDSDDDGACDFIEVLLGTDPDLPASRPLGYEDGAVACSPECGSGQDCYNSVCHNTCTLAADCNSGETCTSNLCLMSPP